ncbi:toxin-antitoxin system YwqK family antitoxin [Spirosoma rhododendri]|uniref:Uncharacterized protein n=1 Tax=Spirosoma rhododendri TaxID=2728024 RepID=A0A7L5DS49_9BACT|nr:hypothetical protein [Spirosoma rhododendri]QJD80965.1 hypothetical protein HH216_22980 [Spirosoma rhododendri]
MKLLLTIIAVCCFTFAHGQSLKTVKVKSKYLLEQYEVRADNDTLRDGTYRKYLRDGDVLLEEGSYANSRRIGTWTFYNRTGQPELIYNYSTAQVITNNRTTATADTMGIIQLEGKGTTVRLTPPPIYLASTHQISAILSRESRPPMHLHREGITELSYQIAATVSPVGARYRIIASHPDREFRQNAQQWAALAFKDVQWLPGSYEGQPVTAIYLLPAITMHLWAVVR